MARKLERRWPDLQKKAGASDDFDRTGALACAVSAVEIAITAAGTAREKGEGVQARLRRCPSLQGASKLPSATDIKAAMAARNQAIHEHRVPDSVECRRHLATLHKVWRELRRTFVNRQQAAILAESILQSNTVSEVFLFGSMARGKRDPHDLDLLLFDDGEFSYLGGGYTDLDWLLTDWILPDDTILSSASKAAYQCGWLDLVFIDGRRLGTDKDYTLNFSMAHDDPLFLINISDGLLKYQPDTNRWVEERPQVFQRLAVLRQQLETENIVRRQSRTG